MSNVVNFKEKYVQTLLEEIEDAEDATDVISIQRKYRVSVELQLSLIHISEPTRPY